MKTNLFPLSSFHSSRSQSLQQHNRKVVTFLYRRNNRSYFLLDTSIGATDSTKGSSLSRFFLFSNIRRTPANS